MFSCLFVCLFVSRVLCTRHAPVSGYYISLGHICLSTALSQDVNLHSLFLSSDVNIPFFLFCGAQLQVLMLTGSLFRHQSCPPCTPSTCSQRPLQREGMFYQFFLYWDFNWQRAPGATAIHPFPGWMSIFYLSFYTCTTGGATAHSSLASFAGFPCMGDPYGGICELFLRTGKEDKSCQKTLPPAGFEPTTTSCKTGTIPLLRQWELFPIVI